MSRVIGAGLNTLLKPLGLKVSRVQPVYKHQIDWKAEYDYWSGLLWNHYDREYGLKPHPIQTDARIVPSGDLVDLIQSPQMGTEHGYFGSGYRNILAYFKELHDHGFRPDRMERILEFGIGLGRLMIHYFPFKAELHGCDVTPDVLVHTRKNLGERVHIENTGLEPPLPYEDSFFDYVYANSVFTHIPCPSVEAWVAELHRIIKPGGCLIVTVFDASLFYPNRNYCEFHRDYEVLGCRDRNVELGVKMSTYLSRDYLHTVWGKYFTPLELRTQYLDQTHFICRKEQ